MSRQLESDSIQWPVKDLPKHWVWVDFDTAITNRTDSIKKIKQSDYLESGTIPIIDQGRDLIGGYSEKKELCYDKELPVIVFGDHTRCVKWIDFTFIQGADGVKVFHPNKIYEPMFLFYASLTSTF